MPHPVDVHVGRKLREARLARNLTQQNLGDRLSISFQQVQRYESGANRMGCSRLWDIARILELPLSFFLDGVEGGLRQRCNAEVPARVLRLASEIEAITDKHLRDQLLALIRTCAKDAVQRAGDPARTERRS